MRSPSSGKDETEAIEGPLFPYSACTRVKIIEDRNALNLIFVCDERSRMMKDHKIMRTNNAGDKPCLASTAVVPPTCEERKCLRRHLRVGLLVLIGARVESTQRVSLLSVQMFLTFCTYLNKHVSCLKILSPFAPATPWKGTTCLGLSQVSLRKLLKLS